jgi:hypothetical protein
LTDCVRLYIEVDNDIVVNKGGEVGATNYITAVYNQLATLYANEQIKTTLHKVVVWNQASPYTSNTSSGLMNQFAAQRPNFDGDLAMLVSYKVSGGIAYVNGICSFSKSFSVGYSGISNNFNTVPTYSWTINILAHEFGHLFGSPHTHACAWNGNNTPYDGCAQPESSCSPGTIPSGGGTIMSYCHLLTGVGVNFQKGFGDQPGNLIRSRVAAANCLSACSGTGGGGGGSTCTTNTLSFEIVTDLYPNETNWQILNTSGTVLFSGSGYSGQLTKTTIPLCLANGCYTFKINDTYGDGICCAQGAGSYKIIFNGNTLISGGQFGSTESKSFCVNGTTTPVPTCTDGVQNGNETGVDCGGSCSPCQTNPCVGNTGPNVSLTKANQSFIAGTPFTITATASDNGTITKVEFFNGTNLLGSDNSSPYEWIINTTNVATYNVTARATDNCNVSTTSTARTYTSTVACNDGVKNGSETGIDCGGTTCSACQTNPCTGNTPPVISLTKANQNFIAGTSFIVTTSASDNGSITKVDFYSGSTLLGSDNTAPYEWTINSAISAAMTISAIATDNCGATTTSAARTYTATVSCTDGVKNGTEVGVDCGGSCTACPTTGTCTNGTLTFVMDAWPTDISWTVKSSNGTTVASGGNYTQSFGTINVNLCLIAGQCYTFTINDIFGDGLCCSSGQGSYKITFGTTILAQGGQFTNIDTKQICIPGGSTPTCTDGIQNGNETGIDCGGSCTPCQTNPCAGNTSPTINLTKPSQNFIAGNAFLITATAADNGTITKVDFYNGSTLLGTDNSAPYEWSITTPIASVYSVTARATDNCGAFTNSGVQTYTATVSCTDGVKNGTETNTDCGGTTCSPCQTNPCAGNTAPVISLVKANQNFVAGVAFLVTTSVSDNGTITKVDFYNGSALLGSDNSAPYEWPISSLVAASFNIKAVAFDNCGASTTSVARSYNATATCTDGVKNGTETGVDCGGSCTACPTGGGGSGSCINGTVNVLTDAYPGEVSWKITDENNVTVLSGGNYNKSFTTFTSNLCLPAGKCYKFIINDAFGDGICCTQGSGNYKITFGSNIIVTGGQFGFTETKSFCVPTTSTSISPSNFGLRFNLYPNPASDKIVLQSSDPNDGDVSVEVIDLFGKRVKKFNTNVSQEIRINTQELSNGQYLVRVAGQGGQVWMRKVVVIK